MLPWAHEKRIRDEQEIACLESQLEAIRQSEGDGYESVASKEALKALELRYRKLLAEKEALWKQKSRAIWLEKGDDNTKFFQAYAKGRKSANTIWHLKDEEGREVSSFEGLSQLGVKHFQNLFK